MEAEAGSLNSNDAYLLKMPAGQSYLWVGKGAIEDEERGALYLSQVLKCQTQRIVEGQEPGENTDSLAWVHIQKASQGMSTNPVPVFLLTHNK